MLIQHNPQGIRKRRRPPLTWCRTMDKETREIGKSWAELKAIVQTLAGYRTEKYCHEFENG